MGTYTIDRDGNIVYDNNTILYLQEEEEKKEEKVSDVIFSIPRI